MGLPRPAVDDIRVKRALLVLVLFSAVSSHAESSYLREHAGDAVKWQGWGDAAFAKAKSEHKLLYLSIGYSGCHWCRVMQEESFKNAEVAAVLNARYVPVLVDRDEMPDVDTTYMTFVETMNNGKAGWPANLILTPDLSPLAAASYMRPDALRNALAGVADQWANNPNGLLSNGAAALALVRAAGQQPAPASAVSQEPVRVVAQRLRELYDKENGGFGSAPKFLQPSILDFMLRRDTDDRDRALESLRKIARSAVHDQVGGGFHRYAVDGEWHMPHFEKLLGDQAMMAMVYTEAWRITKDERYQRVARDTIDYVLRSLKLPKGGFAAGEGADSLTPDPGSPHIAEAAYYTWREEELRKVAWKNADLAVYYFGIQKSGNVPRSFDPNGDFTNHNVLYAHVSDADAMRRFELDDKQLRARLDDVRSRLLLVRSHRPPPPRDENVVIATNALMISALARAGVAFGEDHYVYEANQAMRWLADAKPVFAEDYACLVQALLDTYEATYGIRYLERALELQQKMDLALWSGETLRYASGSRNVPAALRELIPDRDGDLPSPNAVAAMNLLRIATITGSAPARAKAEAIFRSYTPQMNESPSSLPAMAAVLATSAVPAREVIILGNPSLDDTKALLRVIRESYAPIRSMVVAGNDADRVKLAAYIPWMADMKPIEQKATAFVCVGTVCKPPVVDPAKLAGILSE
jgi:uncharacterized protein YyaL (SSP411 family)